MFRSTQMRYLWREGLMGLVRRRISGTVAVLIMGSSLLMLALFSLVTINLDRILQSVRGEIDVAVYLVDDIHPEDQALLHKDLVGTSGVHSVTYVSREQALERFRAELGDDAELLEALQENPLPASFDLRLDSGVKDSQAIRDLVTTLNAYPGVTEVVAQIEWIQRLDRFTRIFIVVDLVVGMLVLLSSLFVISNTVRLTVEESADTVEIMKLVGATDAFIRTPFVLGGALQGALAGALAMGVMLAAGEILSHQVQGIFLFGGGQMFGFVLLSTILGGGGSLLALRRHLQL